MGIREEMLHGFEETRNDIKELMDLNRQMSAKFSDHVASSGVRDAELTAATVAAHDKAEAAQQDINEHLGDHKDEAKERRAAKWALWLLVIGTALTAISALVKVSFLK